MSYNLGTAEGVISTTYNGKGVEDANKDVDGLGKKSLGASEAVRKVGNTAGVAGAAIAAGLGVAVNAAANFEQRMSAVKAVSGASAAEMDQLTKKALQLGKDTSFSAGEAASAIEELVKAGISVPDVMNGAADATVALAAAGEVSLPEAASIASNAMNQFGLSAQEMPKIADLIAGAANASAIDVKDFGFSLSQVGAVANLAGASFGDTAAAIALMGNAGIKGSDAGTSLKTMLSNLQPGTKKQTALFKELGLMTEDGANKFFDAKGNLKSFSEVAGILQNSLKGMTSAQKQAALETLFGSDAIRAAAIFSKEGAAGFDEMTASMTKIKAADVAKTRLDNVKGSLEAMKGSLETMGIVIGQIFIPALRKIVDGITGVLNVFLNLSPGMQKAVVAFIAVVGAVLLLVAATVKIVFAVQKVIEVMKVLRVVMATTWIAALGPIALVIAIIALVVAAIIILWKKSETFRSIVLGVWAAIKTAVQAVLTFFTGTVVPGLISAWNAITNALKATGNFFKSVWDAIVNAVKAAVSFIASVIRTYVNIWKAIITAVVGAILQIWRNFWAIFGGVIKAAFKLVLAVIQLGVKLWLFTINTFTKAIMIAWRAVWNWIKTFVSAIINAIKTDVTNKFNLIRNAVVAVWNAIRNATAGPWNSVRNTVSSVINAVLSVVRSVARAIGSAIQGAWNGIRSLTSSIWGALSGIVSSKLGSVFNTVSGVVSRIRGIFAGAGSWLYNAGRNIISGLLNGIESLIGSVTNKLKSLTNMIPKVKGPPEKDKKLLQKNGQLIMQGLGIGVEKEILPFLRKMSAIGDLIPPTIRAERVSEILPPLGLSPASARVTAPVGAGVSRPAPQINLTTINPVGKPAVEELSDQATRLATLGVFG